MSSELALLLGTAASLGLVHTLVGPDHYLPFVAMARIGRWSAAKTALITVVCGIGHILSSVLLAFLGVALGVAAMRISAIESARGEIAAWLLIAFGLTYFVWGLHRAIRGQPHHHVHAHVDEESHAHEHGHTGEHTHLHPATPVEKMTPWVLFTIFVFGPCEVLIPLVMCTAARHPMTSVALVTGLFGISTIATMLAVVMTSYLGLSRVRVGGMERYSYALGGLVIFLCGGAIKWLGL
jgi:nickel/cobalt exporter